MTTTEFRVGRVLGDALGVWKDNIALIMGLTLLMHAPAIVYTAKLLNQGYLGANSESLLEFTMRVCGFLTMIGVTFVTVAAKRSQKPTLADALRTTASRFFPVLWAMVVFFLVIMGIGMIAFLLMQILAEIGIIIGVLLGVALWLNYWVFVPAAVVEKMGAMASLNRSKDLVLGNKLKILALMLVYMGLFVAVGLAVGVLWGATAWFDLNWMLGTDLLFGLLESSLTATVVSVGYVELRAVHDGASVDELGAVFE